jgi:hypothetical protein
MGHRRLVLDHGRLYEHSPQHASPAGDDHGL